MAPHTISRLYISVLFTWLLGYLLSLAIQYADSDLWYHLAGGRYLLETGNLYNPLINSFLTEPRDFINYFWGFQATVYLTWLLTGETGLIILKTTFFLVCAFFTLRILLDGKRIKDARFLQLFIFAIVIGILCARGLLLRPHLASYAMIPTFIYILAYRERLYFLLPLLTAIWVNLHGVEYIVGALICGSYFLSRLINFSGDSKPLIWIALCLPATFLNPNGPELWLTPFIIDPDLSLFISEMAHPQFEARLSLRHGITTQALLLLFLGFVLTSGILAVKHLKAYLAPILIAAGGCILLIKAGRFVWEWTLLSLPLVAVGLRHWQGPSYRPSTMSALAGIFFLIIMTFWPTLRNGIHHHPFDVESLPHGTTAFIQAKELNGSYSIAPSYAGYIQFMLQDTKIHLDMQFPPFTGLDFHELNVAMLSTNGLETYIKNHSPDMLGVRKNHSNFPTKTAYELGYVPVFFDKKIVLFIGKEKFKDTATLYELKTIDPFNDGTLQQSEVNAGIDELKRMLTVVNSDYIKITLVGYLIEQLRLSEANIYLAELMQSSPNDPSALYYKARFEHLSDQCETAIPYYEQTIEYANYNSLLHRQLAECYFLTGDLPNAYKNYNRGLNPYLDSKPEPLLYLQYALSAAGAGETDIALRLLTMIERFAPHSELMPQIRELSKDLEGV